MAKRKRWQNDSEPEPEEQAEEQPEATELEDEPIEPPEDTPVESVKVEEPPPVPVEELPAIPLKVFVKIAGPKWDQMAGFLSYAKVQKMKPRTVPEWRAAYKVFLQKPTR